MTSQESHVPGKKKLQASDTLLEVVLMDVTEQAIERPQKSNWSYPVSVGQLHFS